MGAVTNISWTDATFNPWIGCTKVSPGCKHCYAETMDRNRFSRMLDGGTPEKPVSHWGKGAQRYRTGSHAWKHPLTWNDLARKGGYRAKVFCASLADWLDPEVPVEWLADLLELIRRTPHLDWQLLTKRPEQWRRRLLVVADRPANPLSDRFVRSWLDGQVPENVWIGTSVEDQKRADERIPQLLKIPAMVRFLSCEPLLEEIGLLAALGLRWEDLGARLHWVIVGGESGGKRRDCGVPAIKNIVRQCETVGVPVFVKQDCAAKPGQRGRLSDALFNQKEFPA